LDGIANPQIAVTDYFKPSDSGNDGWQVVQFATVLGSTASAASTHKYESTRSRIDSLGNVA
jgi:hypothetical protein